MFIIGERINATRKSIDVAVRARDAAYIQHVAVEQAEAGSDALDVNCGTVDALEEPATMEWLVRTVQAVTELPLCIDSPNPDALAAGLSAHKGKPVINSISGETGRYEKVLPLIKQYSASVVALCMDDRGIPTKKEQAIEVGTALVSKLVAEGVPLDEIYLDPLVRAVSTTPESVLETLSVMRELAQRFEGLHFVSGLSNVSFGLPERRHLNRAFVVMSTANGLDAVIADPLDAQLLALIYASEALVNKDRFCLKYIKAFHDGKLKA